MTPLYSGALVSTFVRIIDAYRARYGVTPHDRRRLLAHYPLFKIAWLSVYGRGPVRRLAQRLMPAFAGYRLVHDVASPRGRMRLAIPFAAHEIATFREIFFGAEYRAPFDLSDARTMVDLGANTGLAVLDFCTRAPLERVVAVEANPALIEGLTRNLSAVRGAAIEHAAIVGAPQDEPVRFAVGADAREGRVGGEVGFPVRAVTVRELLDAHEIDEVDILKMDIEGTEHDILAADPSVFKRVRYLFVEVHGDAGARDAFVAALEQLGPQVAHRPGAHVPTCETIAFGRR